MDRSGESMRPRARQGRALQPLLSATLVLALACVASPRVRIPLG